MGFWRFSKVWKAKIPALKVFNKYQKYTIFYYTGVPEMVQTFIEADFVFSIWIGRIFLDYLMIESYLELF